MSSDFLIMFGYVLSFWLGPVRENIQDILVNVYDTGEATSDSMALDMLMLGNICLHIELVFDFSMKAFLL